MKYFFTLVAFIALKSNAASVDTVSIFSNAMKKEFKCVVIKPDTYKKSKNPFPVIYLLHGWSGDFSNWIKKVPAVKTYADKYHVMIVCPDGGYDSWYFDSPVNPAMKYETYIALEVPAYIDQNYKTIKNRSGRAITGLSMGGHGGMFLAFRHADIFGACGAMSGGMNMNYSRTRFGIVKQLGDTIQYADNWKNYSVVNVVENKPKDSLAIIFDCGIDDIFYKDNTELHEKMLQLRIPHDYIVRWGKHDWNYWSNALEYQILFFRKYFDY